MKIKTDFVTNSSSSNYILASDVKVEFKELGFRPEYSSYDNQFECFETIEKLISFTQGRDCDWCDLATGPKHHWKHYSPEWYYKMEKLIKEKKKNFVYYAKVNREDTSEFEYSIKSVGMEIIEADYE